MALDLIPLMGHMPTHIIKSPMALDLIPLMGHMPTHIIKSPPPSDFLYSFCPLILHFLYATLVCINEVASYSQCHRGFSVAILLLILASLVFLFTCEGYVHCIVYDKHSVLVSWGNGRVFNS